METTHTSSYETDPDVQPGIWPVGAKGGFFLGLALFLFSMIFQFFLGFYFTWWTILFPLLAYIGAIIWVHKKYKSSGNGLMSYGKGLLLGIVVGLVAGLITGLLSFLYVNFIDSSVVVKEADAILDLQIEIMERVGAGDPELDEVYDQAEIQKEDMIRTSGNLISTLGGHLFSVTGFSFFLALIISAFTKQKDPELEY